MTTTSVCLPTFNGERFVVPALQSILEQTSRGFEVIVSDDCSTDRTREIVETLKDSRLHLYSNHRRLGLVGNWNRCLELASGGYSYIFHQDDLMLPGALRRLTEVLDRCPNVGFVFSNIQTIDSSGTVVGGHWYPSLPEVDTVFSGKEFFRLLLREGNVVPCPTVMVRSRCFQESGRFDRRLRYTPDLEMWLRLALRYDVAYIAEPLVRWRRHAGQESSRYLERVREVDEVWRAFQIVFSEQFSLIPEPETMYELAMEHLTRWSYAFSRYNLQRRRLGDAWEYARRWFGFWLAKQRGLDGVGTCPLSA